MSDSLEAIYSAFMAGIYDAHTPEAIREYVRADGARDAGQLLAVYRSSVHENLAATLEAIYPAVLRGLGAQTFRRVALDYVACTPSTSPSLDDYGDHFPAYIAQHRALSEYPYLAGIAQLDWTWHRAFHAADLEPVATETLALWLQECSHALMLFLPPGAALISSKWPLYDIWRMNRGLIAEQTIDLQSEAQACLVWRQDYDVCVACASPCERAIFQTSKKPQYFGTKVDALLSNFDASEVVNSLIQALQRGWLVAEYRPQE